MYGLLKAENGGTDDFVTNILTEVSATSYGKLAARTEIFKKTIMDMVTMIMVFDSLEAGNTAANWDKAAAYFIGRTTTAGDSSHATYGRAQKRGEDYGQFVNGEADINKEIITLLKTPDSTNLATIKELYQVLYAQATLKYAHSIDEAIEHEGKYDAADELAEMVGEGLAFWRLLKPFLKARDATGAAIIDDIYDLERVPKDDPYFVHGTNYYTYCKVKEIIDAHVATLTAANAVTNFGSYGEASDVSCLYGDAGNSIETGIGGITPYTGATYTPNIAVGAGNVGASLYYSEAVKKVVGLIAETSGNGAVVKQAYYAYGLRGVADRPREGATAALFDGASGFNDVNWISDLIDAATAEPNTFSTNFGARAEMIEKTLMDTLAVRAIMDDLEHSVDTAHGHGAAYYTNLWDHAFATFIGTTDARSKTVYARGNKRGANYGDNDANGVSQINKNIVNAFIAGSGSANTATRTTQIAVIKKNIQIIYARAVLRYAFLVNQDVAQGNPYAEHQAEGLAFFYTIAPWVKAADAAGHDLVLNFFHTSTIPDSYNYFSYCAVKKVMETFLGSDSAKVGTLEGTDAVSCASTLPSGLGGVSTSAGTYTPTSDVGASLSFSIGVKAVTDLIDATTTFADVKAKYLEMGVRGAADEVRTAEPYWEASKAFYGSSGNVDWMTDYLTNAADDTTMATAARKEIVEKTVRDQVAVMAILSDLYKGSKGTTAAHKRYWDHGAAKYLGTDDARSATVYNRANKRAANYGTADDTSGEAKANHAVVAALVAGKTADTVQARSRQYDAVVTQMKVIYGQCVVRYAYLIDQDIATGADYAEHQAEGQAFWRVIAPWVKDVDPNGATYLEGIFDVARAPTHAEHFCHAKEIVLRMGVEIGTLEGTGGINCEGRSAPEDAAAYLAGDGILSGAGTNAARLVAVAAVAAVAALF